MCPSSQGQGDATTESRAVSIANAILHCNTAVTARRPSGGPRTCYVGLGGGNDQMPQKNVVRHRYSGRARPTSSTRPLRATVISDLEITAFSPSVTHPQSWPHRLHGISPAPSPISLPNPPTHTQSSEFRVYSSLHTANRSQDSPLEATTRF